jgi:hypothetical protein
MKPPPKANNASLKELIDRLALLKKRSRQVKEEVNALEDLIRVRLDKRSTPPNQRQ